MKVVWISIVDIAWLPDLDHFMLLHEDWVDLDYILKQSNVTLYGVTRSHVLFCVTKPDVAVYSSSFPFVFLGQHFSAEKLVVMPIEYFHQLADKMGDPTIPVTVLNNMGRCGSTLICQMLSRVPRIRVMSEPWPLYCLQDRYRRGQFTQHGYKRLIVSLIRMQCKKETDEQIDLILLKLPFTCVIQMEDIRALLPQIKHIFLLRQPLAAIRSLLKIYLTGAISRDQIDYYSNPLLQTIFEDKTPPSRAQMTAASQLFTIKAARDFVKGGPFLGVFTYEDLVKKENVLEELMNIFNLSEDEKVEALKALREDSQGNTPISKSKLNMIKVDEIDVEDFDEIRNLYEMPNLDSDVDMFRKYIQ